MLNLKLVESQPHWRVALVARFAELMGVLIHVEGISFGSNRTLIQKAQESMGPQAFSNPCSTEGGGKAATKEHEEIAVAWTVLEDFGFPPEACGWPARDMAGVLPEAVECALDCLIRQRDDLIHEVVELRKLRT